MKITDKKRTFSIRMVIWQGTGYSPDFSLDFFDAGGLEYDDETDTYKVDDVDYCIDQALDWQYNRGDFQGDLVDDGKTVFIDDL